MGDRGIKRKLDMARANVSHVISGQAAMGKYAAGLAGEGYNGGYRDALDDVLLALNGVTPRRHGWWETSPPNTRR